MKKVILMPLLFIAIACLSDEIDEPDFVCTVDYIEFKLNNLAVIKFDVEFGGAKDSYFVEQTYQSEESNYYVGDKLINILNFTTKGEQEASFIFEYAENLGPFCVDLFSDIPIHSHDSFSGEAEKVLNGKNLGKWKIKKKTKLERN